MHLHRPKVPVEPIQDVPDQIGTCHQVPMSAVVQEVLFVLRPGAERLKQRHLTSFQGKGEVMATVDHQHRGTHSGSEVPGVRFCRLDCINPPAEKTAALKRESTAISRTPWAAPMLTP